MRALLAACADAWRHAVRFRALAFQDGTPTSPQSPPSTQARLAALLLTRRHARAHSSRRHCTHFNACVLTLLRSGAGDLFRVETVDWTGGQIHDNDDASDIRDVNLLEVHYLSGPIAVNDAAGAPAQPGDLLCVEICQLGPLPGDEWGFTGAQQRSAAVALRVQVLRSCAAKCA